VFVDFCPKEQKFIIQSLEFSRESILKLLSISGIERDVNEDVWKLPYSKAALRRLAELFNGELRFTPQAKKELHALDQKGSYVLDYDKDSGRFLLFADSGLKRTLEPIGDCRYRKAKGCWSIPGNHWSIVQLYRLLGKKSITPLQGAQERLDYFTQKLSILDPLIRKINTIKSVNRESLHLDGYTFRGKYEPYDHQLKMWWSAYNVLKSVDDVGFFLFCGVGTGKSLVAANVGAALHEKGLAEKILVVTPASLKFNFAEQIQIHTPYSCNVLVSYAPDRRKGREGRRWRWTESTRPITDYYQDYNVYLEEPDSLFHIVNFEAITAEPEAFMNIYDFLIVDEVHYIKGRTSARTKALKRVASTIPRRLGMTGTPVAKDPLDVWSLYNVIDPDIFPNRYVDFEERVAIKKMVGGAGGKFPIIVGWKPEGIEWVNRNIYKRAIRYKTEECLDLPEKIYQRVVISPPAEVEKFYKELKKDLVAEIGEMGQEGYRFVESPNSLAVISKLRQVASGFVGIPDEDNPSKTIYHSLDDFKFKAAVDLLKDLEGHQVILWYWHSYVRDKLIDYIKQEFKEAPMVIDGEASAKEKAKRIHQFQQGAYRFAVWNVQVSEGNTATAADVAIYVENSFSYKDRNQSEGRIYREGQKNTTIFIDLVTKGTVDLRILKAIEDGEDLSEAVLLEEILKGM